MLNNIDYERVVMIIAQLISSLGFPIFVAVWLLYKTDKLLQEVRDVMIELRKDMSAYHQSLRVLADDVWRGRDASAK